MMFFTSMLKAPVTPLSEHKPPAPGKKNRGNSHPNHSRANEVRSEKAKAKYIAAIGPEWTRTATVESRLGMSRSSCTETLTKYFNEGILDRRPVDGKPYNRRAGWEWRVK